MAKLYFYYSAMNAGKSTVLLQSAYNYKERGMDSLLFTPDFDDRYGLGKITSRIGLDSEAVTFGKEFDFFAYAEEAMKTRPNLRCLLIDEAQFLTRDQVHQLSMVTLKLNIPVLAYGLRTDFQAEPFEGSKYLLAWAEEFNEIKTICHCGSKATMNLRIDEKGRAVRDGAQVEIGNNDRYVATCRRHFEAGDSGRHTQKSLFEEKKESVE